MKISYECIPCIARQSVEVCKESIVDLKLQQDAIKLCLKSLSSLEFNETAPEIAHRIHNIVKDITGIEDPYKDLKVKYNKIAEDLYKKIKAKDWMGKSEDPFDLACRLSIAGNIIDFSVGLTIGHDEIVRSIENSLHMPIFGLGTKELKKEIEKTKKIMILGDNAGEIIFDKFLLEALPKEKITYVVKGGPIVNDAIIEDAISSGLINLVKVIDNGHNAQGTILTHCSKDFIEEFNSADLIISKGQANFETLSDCRNKNIYYLLRAKCKSVADSIGCKLMDYVLTKLQ